MEKYSKAQTGKGEPSPPDKKANAEKNQNVEKKSTPPKTSKSGKDKGEGAKPAGAEVDAAVLAEAAQLGIESALNNLAGRAYVKDLKKTNKYLLEAIKSSCGLVKCEFCGRKLAESDERNQCSLCGSVSCELCGEGGCGRTLFV